MGHGGAGVFKKKSFKAKSWQVRDFQPILTDTCQDCDLVSVILSEF